MALRLMMASTAPHKIGALPVAAARGIGGLVREMLPPVSFFFIALTLMFTVLKLLALQYEIHFYAFARAAIGALVLGKIVLLMEMAGRKRKASKYPRALVVAFKTVVYAAAVVGFEFGERIVRAWYGSGSLQEGLAIVKAHANLDHFLALLILGCTILAVYLAMEEISKAMGEGALKRLFFERRETA
jgi:fumarate reductase subunit D